MKKINKTKIVFRTREFFLMQDDSGAADFSDSTKNSVCPLCHSQISLAADAAALAAAPTKITSAHDCPETEN